MVNLNTKSTNLGLIGVINTDGKLTGNISLKTKYNEYEGNYEITPSNKINILNTKDKVLYENIVVNPIPSNYGLITWNGHILTVS